MSLRTNISTLAAFAAHPRRFPTYQGYTNGFIYGFGMGASTVLFPLYAISLGFRLSDQGIIVAAPATVMILLRLIGGALSDRFGEKFILWFSFITLIISSVIAAFSASLLPLIVAQLFNGGSRSVYWSAAQSYISRSAEGEAGKVMGKQLSFESGGGIIGGIIAGVVAQHSGYTAAFLMTAGITLVGFSVTSTLAALPRKDQARSFAASLAPAKKMLFARVLLHAHLVAFTSAAYIGLVMGIFIAFFRDLQYSESETAFIRSLNSIGVTAVGYVFGMLLGRLGSRRTAAIGITLTGLLSVGIGVTGHLPILPVVFMGLTGLTFGSLRSLYPTLAAENSDPNQRAMSLAVVGLYWAIGIFVSPLVFSFIADATDSILVSIYIFGAFATIVGVLSPLLYDYGRRGVVQANPDAVPGETEKEK